LRRLRAAQSEGAKSSPWGGFTPSKMAAGRRHLEAQGWSKRSLRGCRRQPFSLLCGGRLKELFEKSSLRNLKNFPAAVV